MLGVNEQFPEFALTAVHPNGNAFYQVTEEDLLDDWSVITKKFDSGSE